MYNEEELFNELLSLNKYEKLGYEYFLKYQEYLNLEQIFYIHYHNDDDITIDTLHNLDIKDLRKKFYSIYAKSDLGGMREVDYIEKGKNFTLNSVLRYCNLPDRKQDFIELITIINGECVVKIEKESYTLKSGDLVIIPTGTTYNLYPNIDAIAFTANVRVRTFIEQFSKGIDKDSKLANFIAKALILPYFNTAIIIHSNNDNFFRSTMLNIYYQEKQNKKLSNIIIENMWLVLITYLVQNYEDNVDYIINDKKNFEFLAEVISFISNNIEKCSLQDAADYFNLNYSYLSYKIKDISNVSYAKLVKTARLKRAATYLRTTNLKVNDICDKVGYIDPAQFNKLFKKEYGVTPIEYRKESNNKEAEWL